jgi:hypothetical protein
MGLGAAMACGALSCRQIVGFDESRQYAGAADGGFDGGASACGLPYGNATCAACAHASCCSEAKACEANPVCNPYETCVGACRLGDFACRARCEIDHPAGTASEVSAVSACLATHCENDCGLACGALAGWAVEPDAAAAFQSCVASSSCDRVRACARSAECDAVTRCYGACPTPDCVSTCVASHGVDPAWCFSDAGETPATSTFTDFASAVSNTCRTATGNDWECAGHVSWPALQAATSTLQGRIRDVLTSKTMSGIEVQACGLNDVDCTSPWGGTYSDASGWFSMEIPLVFSSYPPAYLKVTLDPTSATPSVRTYVYWGFPLTQARYVSYRCYNTSNSDALTFDTLAENQSITSAVASQFDGGMADRGRGSVGVVALDCVGQRAPGVEVTLSSADSETITVDSNLMRTAPITDSTGTVVFLQVPAGPVTVTAVPPVIGRPSGKVDAYVRAGADFPYTDVVVQTTPLP